MAAARIFLAFSGNGDGDEGRTLLWWLSTTFGGDRDDGGLVGVELGGTCERPGPTGPVPLSERPSRNSIVVTCPRFPSADYAYTCDLPSDLAIRPG